MSASGFRFDPSQPYQLDAVRSVVDLFDGQPKDAEKLRTMLQSAPLEASGDQIALGLELSEEVGAIGNNLVLDQELVLANLQRVQDRNGLEVAPRLHDDALDFDVEMETGTGKTYVYLRTIFELADRYGFTKFIILVPSVAIREGVNTSIRLMREHFRSMYPAQPFDASVYSGKNAEEVQGFATATSVQILVMTIDSIRGTANTRIMHQTRDKLNGLRPVDYLKATRPVVIMDEPQKMESALSQSSVGELDPAFTLRYSATHKKQRNVVYRLDPVDAHDLGLVKQIVVADVRQQGADAKPYVKLLEVKGDPFVARLELACRAADGNVARKEVRIKKADLHRELSGKAFTDNPVYDGWRVTNMSIASYGQPGSVELTLHGNLYEGESIGGTNGAIYKEMIRETIREHLQKERWLRAKNIKVLSLFFVDKVANYMGAGVSNQDANGEFAMWFDEVFVEERAKSPQYLELLPESPRELRRAYFSQLKSKGKVSFEDTSGATKADDDAYELIMQDKERLLDMDEPVRFIFSHSALQEGWDNPNVFQICTLREMGKETERRQTIGRGLRLPVTRTEAGYERVPDRDVATLTVVAGESYQDFAKSLQKEYKAAGVEIGQVRPSEFAKIALRDDSELLSDRSLGYQKSVEIWRHLEAKGFIKEGQITSKFLPDTLDFDLSLPEEFRPYESEIVALVARASMERYVKPASKRQVRKLNKELYRTPEFEEFWRAISQRTTYRVTVDRGRIIDACVAAIGRESPIEPLRIQVTRAGVKVLRGGAKGVEIGSRSADLKGSYDLPDIVSELQEATSLTRQTIIDVLIGSGRLDEFIGNPNDFIAMARRVIQDELAKLVVDGIQYERVAGYVYELRELQKDGEEEKQRFLDQLYKVKNTQKTDYDYVVCDSDSSPERQFAEILDDSPDVKLFMKLPPKFKISTPVGPYNPDWAIVKEVEGEDRIYMIRETKSTDDRNKRRPIENAKIDAARRHFAAIGIGDYEVSVPGRWKL